MKKAVFNFFKGVLILCVAAKIGYAISGLLGNKTDYNSVVLRVSNSKKDVDYDLGAAMRYLEAEFKKAGFKVLGETYTGDLYNKKFDAAGINVYVRGYPPFYDLRMRMPGINIYYLHRFSYFYKEELRNFQYYLSSQKNIWAAMQGTLDVEILENGFLEHERLEPEKEYESDVVYIYEYYNEAYGAFLKYYMKALIYSGAAFERLGEERRKKVMKNTKLVVYDAGFSDKDDNNYVPYAVLDIISYGRPLLTNRRFPLELFMDKNVYLFNDTETMMYQTHLALQESNEVREEKAKKARERLNKGFKVKNEFFEKLRKERKIKLF